MSLQPILIGGLITAVVLYSIAAFIYRRKGMGTKTLYAFVGADILALLIFALIGLFGLLSQGMAATILTMVATFTIIFALQWRAPGGQRQR